MIILLFAHTGGRDEYSASKCAPFFGQLLQHNSGRIGPRHEACCLGQYGHIHRRVPPLYSKYIRCDPLHSSNLGRGYCRGDLRFPNSPHVLLCGKY